MNCLPQKLPHRRYSTPLIFLFDKRLAIWQGTLSQRERKYALARDGYLGIDEADDTYNDLNRKIIDAYWERYGAAYLGRINYSGNQRQRIVDGTESVFEAYTGQPLYNFCCDFCVTAPDRTLEELIQHWNNAAIPLSEKKVDAIMDRIQVLCGQTFIWY